MESRERTKLYMVIGLAVLFVAVGYVRFVHGKIAFFNPPERGVAHPVLPEVPAVDLKGLEPAGLPQKTASGPRAGLRDIFAPAKKTGTATRNGLPSGTAAAVPLPTLQLTGTIIGGKRPMAVINGRFLRKGDLIAGFEVVSIVNNQVTLAGGGRKVLLNMLTGAEERSP
jgi:hypothetical protein